MTPKETYETLLQAIAEKLKSQEEQIAFYKWKCDDLTAKLEEAERSASNANK